MSVWAVLLGAGSASAQPEETEGTCSNYALSPSEATLSSDGGSGTLDLTWDWEAPEVEEFCIANCTNASCGEQTGSVRSSATWLTATKNGDDQVDYTVAGGYTGSSSREATLTVAGATFTVTQQPPGPCPSSPDRLSSTSLSFPAATSVRYVSVAGRSDCSWSVSGDQDWLTTPSSVSGGGLVRVQADENPGGAREGTVAIGGSSVSVSQASGCPASPTTVSPSSLTFPAAGGTQSLSVTGPARCSWSVSDDRTWITATPTSVSTGGEVTVTVPLGHGGESGTVTIGNQAIPVSVTRSACPRTPDSVTPSSLTFPSPGGTQSLSVAGPAHCSWPVSDDRAWITATPSRVSAGGTVQVRVTPGPPGRSGTVSIGRATVPVTVEPCPGSPTSVTPSSLRFPPAGGTQRLSVAGPTGCSWSVSDDQAWIAATPSRVSDGGRVTVTLGSGSAGESGTVTIGGRNIPIIVDPCQASPTSVTPTRLTFTSATGSRNVTVAGLTGCSWDVTASATWIRVASTASPGRFAIGVDANEEPARSGTVTIGGVSVNVGQESGCAASVVPRSLSFTASAGSKSVTVSGGRGCSWGVNASDSWIRVVSTASPGRFAIGVQANEESARSGRVTIGGVEVDIQQGGHTEPPCGPPSSVMPRSLSFTASAGSKSVTVSGGRGCSWNVVASDTWIRVASTASPGRFAIGVDASEEPARSGTVTIGGVSVNVGQESGCAASVMPRSLSFTASAGSESVTVSGGRGCSWVVTASDTWIRVASTASPGRFGIGVDANPGSTRRSGMVTIGSARVDVEQPAVDNCAVTVAPPTLSFTAAGGSHRVAVTGPTGCSWAVSSDPNWIGAMPATASNGDAVTVTVTGHVGSGTRSGSVTIGNQSIPVTQSPPPSCPSSPASVTPASLIFTSAGGTQNVTVAGPAGCNWPVTTDQSWITKPTRVSPGTMVVTIPQYAGTEVRSGTVTVGGLSITVHQPCPVRSSIETLTESRDRLICDWATRKGHANVCTAWQSLHFTAKQVFIWNTHRLHISTMEDSNMLAHVTKLYSITPRDGSACGGEGYNRTFMSMTPQLQARLLRASGGDRNALPQWRESLDPACVFGFVRVAGGKCPHPPFWYQAETKDKLPTGQIQLFSARNVIVDRDHFQGVDENFNLLRSCGSGSVHRLMVRLDDVCNGTCVGHEPVGVCASTNYRDTITKRPEDLYHIPVDGTPVRDAYSFEMDQDYNFAPHHSAPSCDDMTETYSNNYNDPGWHWSPSACSATHVAGAPFTFEDIASQPFRATNVVELRARIDGLRRVHGLPTFSWTDEELRYGITLVRVVHLAELRTALRAVYATVGRVAPEFTDETIVAGVTFIKSAHLMEIRAALIALEGE